MELNVYGSCNIPSYVWISRSQAYDWSSGFLDTALAAYFMLVSCLAYALTLKRLLI
jgi:hypothetical protein